MKNPLNKHAAAPPPDVEQMLRASTAWEADALLPPDFAAFTRQALEKPKRTPWTGGFLRLPVAVGLASACILWMGGRLNVSPEAVINAAVPVSYAASAPAPAPPKEAAAPWAGQSPLTLASDEAGEPLTDTAAPEPALRSGYHATAAGVSRNAGQRSRRHHNAVHRAGNTETVSVRKPRTGNESAFATAAVWETETVERPAWGALVPIPAAECAEPDTAAAESTEGSEPSDGEATSAILPVLDVALPDPETPMPAPSAAPIRSPEK